MKKAPPKYPPYPDAKWDYSIVQCAAQQLKKPNKFICIYCHGQAIRLIDLGHEADCPARNDTE